jgi:hypothetical protein
VLAYQPAGIARYRVEWEGNTSGMPAATSHDTMRLELAFTSSGADQLAARVTTLTYSSRGMDRDLDIELTRDALRVSPTRGVPQTYERGKPGNFDIAGMFEQPIATASVTASLVRMVVAPQQPLLAVSGSYDVQLAARISGIPVLLFPVLREAAVEPTSHWEYRVPRRTRDSQVDVVYRISYVDDRSCPSGGGTCAHLELVGEIPSDADLGVPIGLRDPNRLDRYEGAIDFDLARGRVDQSIIHVAHAQSVNDSIVIRADGTYTFTAL